MTTEEIPFVLNRINSKTGEYLQQVVTPEEILKKAASLENSIVLEKIGKNSQDKDKKEFGLMKGVDAKNLAQTGWGVIFACDNSAEGIKEKLKSLLDHRKKQAKDYYKEYKYCSSDPNDLCLVDFDRDTCVRVPSTNVVDPKKIPYYLLIVGDPKTIPYSFQYQLDVAYAVGRIYFEKLEDYERYACNVVKAETGEISRPRQPPRAVFFGVQHERDPATKKSIEKLISPLYQWVKNDEKIKDWNVEMLLVDQAKKEQLKKLLGGSETPDFLFTASHGMSFEKGGQLQQSDQGALLCQDWPGSGTPTENKNFYFSADDVGDDAQLHGLISFHFACHSVGTPDIDDFDFPCHSVGTPDIDSSNSLSNNKNTALKPFVARLPQRLLSQGALAVVGHVGKLLEYSFVERGITQLENFQDTLRGLMNGEPVGHAVESFNEHHSRLACGLWEKIQDCTSGESEAQSWLSFRNARSYAIVGDPAVRLAVEDAPKSEQPLRETEQSPPPSILEPSADEPTSTFEVSSTVFDESILRQAERQLTQALEQFLNVVEQAPADDLKQLQSTVDAVKNRLDEAVKTLESVKLKQAQFQFIQAIEEFISTAAKAERLQPIVKDATELLNTLKKLS